MEKINELLGIISGYVWNLPLVIALMGTGVLFTLALHFVQFKGFIHALKVVRGKFDNPNDPGEINHFAALTTALSATVGLGNIGGVAVAIHIGGPGAVFWMIVVGFIGMATKFAECSLAVMYRRIDKEGEVHGGPMHYIERGLGMNWKPLAVFFAFACMVASFGAANMFQTNQVAHILNKNFSIPPLATGLTIAILTAIVIIGGIKRIGQVTSRLVPIMGGIYMAGALVVIIANITQVPEMIWLIIHDAFNGTAAQGGIAGIAVQTVLIQGVRRACFSNEAGLGSSPIAHAAAATNEPIREGTVALLEPFIDTIVICTMTALVILLSGAWTQDANGVELTALAFDSIIPGFGHYFVPVAVTLFAYSTLISWSYYGERSVDYLWGSKKGILFYKIVFCILAVAGALWEIGPVLNFSDIMLGLMAAPNLLALIILMPKVRSETIKYFNKLKEGKFIEHGPTI
jgi:AGCS family alanine or glycine:cation symporter